jgi:hypothetical protein
MAVVKMGHQSRKSIIFALIIIILGVLSLEGIARFFWSYKTLKPVVPPTIGQFDEKLGWSLKPLSHGTSNRTGYEIEYRINSKGLRGPEVSYAKPEGRFRIVLLGDSRTFGFGVPIEKHFSTLLQGYFKDVEVINMGVGGFGVDQELLYLQLEGVRYQPEIVLAYVAHYGNHRHMHTERFGKKKPRFVLDDGNLALINSPIPASDQTSNLVGQIHRWFIKYSKLYEILIKSFFRLTDQKVLPIYQIQHDRKNLENEEFRKELYELGEALVHAIYKESLAHGAMFVLVTQIKELHEGALKRRILSLDVSRALSNPSFALPDNLQHINESGNGVLAWEIAKFLQAYQLIPTKHLIAESYLFEF